MTDHSLPRPVSESNPLVNALLRAMRDARTELRLNDAKAALNILSETLDDYAAGLLPLDAAPTTPPPPPAAAPDGDVTAAQSLLASISEPLKLTPADAAHFAAKADERESAPAAAPAPTGKLLTALELLNKQTVMWDEIVGEWRICRGNMITSQKVNARVVKSLIAHGLLSKVDDDEYAVSAAGRAALGGER